MVTVKLHGMPHTASTRRAWVIAKEIGLDVKIVPVNMSKGEHKDPAYIDNYHPFGITPVLEDEDGTKVYESRAIARYLVTKYAKGSTLLPDTSDPKAYGLFEQAASIEYSSFDPSASALSYERVFGPMKGPNADKELIKRCVETLDNAFSGYERILSKQKFLAGDNLTLADLFHLPYGKIIYDLEPQLYSKRPNLTRWWKEVATRQTWHDAQRLQL
ncbi:unnamed protein product [Rhizoctonia solani]|uniref:glutathione transferase n=1 Tax=Rhizoctonia solani TaxID=456999 RepID=A0A8H3B4G5_9AGAM|nr:unnamed protein product [Rhizoctonia solani]